MKKQTLDPKWTVDTLRRTFQDGQMTDTLGIELKSVRPDGLDAVVVVGKKHLRPDGIANGGLALVLVETVGSVSGCCSVDFERFNVLGLNVAVNHFKSAREGQTLVARSFPVHTGRSTHVWDVVISNEAEQLVSSGRITLMVIPRTEKVSSNPKD
jgi:1,4-dihydroxy-2-naphthoyl-CoA hydrolase